MLRKVGKFCFHTTRRYILEEILLTVTAAGTSDVTKSAYSKNRTMQSCFHVKARDMFSIHWTWTGFLITTPRIHQVEWRYSFIHSLPLVRNAGDRSVSLSSRFNPGEIFSSNRCVGDLLGPGTGLEKMEKIKVSVHIGNRNPITQSSSQQSLH
jgi:hypothetical protein